MCSILIVDTGYLAITCISLAEIKHTGSDSWKNRVGAINLFGINLFGIFLIIIQNSRVGTFPMLVKISVIM